MCCAVTCRRLGERVSTTTSEGRVLPLRTSRYRSARWQGYSPSQCAQTSWYGPGLSEVLANAACITSEVLAAALALGGLGRPGDKLCLERHVAPFSGCWCRDHASRPGALITNEEPISMELSNSLGADS